MANTITISALTELLYKSRDIVAAEPSALVNSCLINSDGIERVSLGGTVNSFVTAQPTLNTSYTPAMTIPSGDDQTVSALTMTIGQVANVKIPLKGETVKQIENTGGDQVFRDMLTQAFRTIRNAIETHVGLVTYKGASRATGTAGTTPFASNHNSVNALRQILVDNGCPADDGQISLVMNTLAGTNVRNLSNLYKVNEGGNDALLRRGVLQDISGLMLKESAGIATTTAGTASSATTDNAGYAVGATTFTLASAGTGTIVAGDVITFAGDTNKYVVVSGDADVSNGGTITIAAPGLRVAMSAATKAITVTAAYTANVGFHKNAVELVVRPPALPKGGDAAEDRTTMADSKSPLVYEVALYKGYGMNLIDITTFYQAKVWKPEFVATLLG